MGQRQYMVKFEKDFVYGDKVYPNNAHFCIKDLKTHKLVRYFTSDHIKVKQMIVYKLKSKEIIYKGNNYDDYLKAVEEYLK